MSEQDLTGLNDTITGLVKQYGPAAVIGAVNVGIQEDAAAKLKANDTKGAIKTMQLSRVITNAAQRVDRLLNPPAKKAKEETPAPAEGADSVTA